MNVREQWISDELKDRWNALREQFQLAEDEFNEFIRLPAETRCPAQFNFLSRKILEINTRSAEILGKLLFAQEDLVGGRDADE